MRNKSSDGQEEVFWSLDCKIEAEDFIRFTSLPVSLRMMDQRFLFLYVMDTASKIHIWHYVLTPLLFYWTFTLWNWTFMSMIWKMSIGKSLSSICKEQKLFHTLGRYPALSYFSPTFALLYEYSFCSPHRLWMVLIPHNSWSCFSQSCGI